MKIAQVIGLLSLFLLLFSISMRTIAIAQDTGAKGWELEYSAEVAAEKLLKSVVLVETRFDKPRNDDKYLPWAYFRGGRPLKGLYGSGFVYKDPRYVITNYFILDNAEYIRVVTWDGKAYPAKLKAKSEPFRIAVLEVDWGPNADVVPVKLASPDDLAVGEPISITGRSETGRDYVSTVGVISAIRKQIPTVEVPTEEFIQFDAAFSLPMTGAPLVNVRGEVVGMVSGTVTEFGGSNINLAVPVGDLEMIADRIIAGKTETPWSGMEGMVLTPQIRMLNKIPERISQGLFVTYVEPGSPADISGLKPADVILSLDDTTITQVFDYNAFMRRVEVGQVIHIKYWRFVPGVSDNPSATGGDIFETVMQIVPAPEEGEEGSSSSSSGSYHHH